MRRGSGLLSWSVLWWPLLKPLAFLNVGVSWEIISRHNCTTYTPLCRCKALSWPHGHFWVLPALSISIKPLFTSKETIHTFHWSQRGFRGGTFWPICPRCCVYLSLVWWVVMTQGCFCGNKHVADQKTNNKQTNKVAFIAFTHGPPNVKENRVLLPPSPAQNLAHGNERWGPQLPTFRISPFLSLSLFPTVSSLSHL